MTDDMHEFARKVQIVPARTTGTQKLYWPTSTILTDSVIIFMTPFLVSEVQNYALKISFYK